MIIDISWPLTNGMTEYKDRSTVHITQLKTMQKDRVQETSIALHNHSGTHIDAPAHFIAGGKTLDQFSLQTFLGESTVLDMTQIEEKITSADLEKHTISAGDRVLLKTRNSQRKLDEPFDYSFIYLAESGARYLTEKQVQLVGIDYLGIERNQPKHETHITLLQNNILILEGVRLAAVEPGVYTLICLPLAIPGIDAVPARAVLQK